MTYEELCLAVGEIDKEAEHYMRTCAKKLNSFCSTDHDSLDEVFRWDKTPQGHNYWSDINNKL